jgi:hypothetical protein
MGLAATESLFRTDGKDIYQDFRSRLLVENLSSGRFRNFGKYVIRQRLIFRQTRDFARDFSWTLIGR